jgi:hypothetical protein
MRCLLTALALSLIIVNQGFAQCATGGAVWLNGQNDGQFRDTGVLGGYVFAEAVTSGTMASGRPIYTQGSSVWKGLTYASLQVWRAYSSPASNTTYFKLSQALDSNIFHVRVDNIRGDLFNWESQNVRGYLNGVEVPADFKDPVNGATASGNTISGGSTTNGTTQSSMRVFFHTPVDSIVVRQASWSDWIIAELQVQCNVVLPGLINRWSAARNGNDVNLQWSILTETNIRNYVVQHSTDGLKFKDFAVLPNTASKHYSLTHKNIDAGAQYYRLLINFHSGTQQTSTVKLVRALPAQLIRMFPNPAHNKIMLHLPATETVVKIWDGQGQLVYSGQGKGEVSIDVSSWSKGIYMVRAENRNQMMLGRLVVQ